LRPISSDSILGQLYRTCRAIAMLATAIEWRPSRELDLTQPTSNEAPALDSIQLGLGAWAWGDRSVWQYGRGYAEGDVRDAFRAAVAENIRFVDTAEVYGSGRSERIVGELVRESTQPITVATKYFPWPWRLTSVSFLTALRGSLDRMGLDAIGLYQVHWPTPLMRPEYMMDALFACVRSGMCRSVGVSNFDEANLLRAHTALAKHSVPLASNQVHYSLLQREVEQNGLLARCKELGVRLIAYSPLEMGLLTGKYGPGNPPPGNRGLRYAGIMGRIGTLLNAISDVGQEHGGKTNAQVALNWLIAKGALPIPGAKTAAQAQENAGALGWTLTEEQIAKLDEASNRV
jgi:aryl-alcohol dehydrogenase-like predicted oxidoreductase